MDAMITDTPLVVQNELGSLIREQGIKMVGFADLGPLTAYPMGVPAVNQGFVDKYPHAVLMGIPLDVPHKNASGRQASLFLEGAAIQVLEYLGKQKFSALIVHTDDELDPVERRGLVSLKALARMAGIGWQGRSLLIMSPEFGAIHRIIAVLTDMPVGLNEPVDNLCQDCSLCVDHCPQSALTWVGFEDHPEKRSDVLDVELCLGDDGCRVCMEVCPYAKK